MTFDAGSWTMAYSHGPFVAANLYFSKDATEVKLFSMKVWEEYIY